MLLRSLSCLTQAFTKTTQRPHPRNQWCTSLPSYHKGRDDSGSNSDHSGYGTGSAGNSSSSSSSSSSSISGSDSD
jgi:hypothetical protein